VKKIILRKGERDIRPSKEDLISINVSSFCRSTGKLFSTTRSRDNFQQVQMKKFHIGMGEVIKGWDIGISKMQLAERALIRCTSEFVGGQSKKTVDFIVELEDVPIYVQIRGTKKSILKKIVQETEEEKCFTSKEWWLVTATYCGREENETGRIWCQGVNEDVKIPFDLEFENKGCIPEYDQPRGFFLCLRNVKIGETAHFQLKCNNFYSFGSKGSEKFDIPPNTNL